MEINIFVFCRRQNIYDIHEAELSEKVQLMDKHAEVLKAQGRKTRNIGFGIGAAAVGGGVGTYFAVKAIKEFRKS